MAGPYHGEFGNWSDVQAQFDMKEPEPAEVLHASYSYEDYSGDANVLFRAAEGGFGYVSGGHCSCYGLEGQWDVEIFTGEQLLGQVDRANYGFFKDQADLIRRAVS